MGRVDRTKHNFDILEHVLGGVTTCADAEPDVITYQGQPVNRTAAAEIEITLHHAGSRPPRSPR